MTQEDQIERPSASVATPYLVTAWHDAKVRKGPSTGTTPIVSYVVKNGKYNAFCWVSGETIHDPEYKITNEIWIKLSLKGGGIGYVSAVYLKGGKYAGLPASASC